MSVAVAPGEMGQHARPFARCLQTLIGDTVSLEAVVSRYRLSPQTRQTPSPKTATEIMWSWERMWLTNRLDALEGPLECCPEEMGSRIKNAHPFARCLQMLIGDTV
ncbi:hypothetical protein CEXT_87111 [Caerostris extrusa]|uniref:Uncharacterized protein n=1 Tax=Caerostris extrusa TaxID=172846 RepID=A0AAV4TCF9_CAEEX|nr:hypothetical protein CEXT_87111 [Caerostris extrusa]